MVRCNPGPGAAPRVARDPALQRLPLRRPPPRRRQRAAGAGLARAVRVGAARGAHDARPQDCSGTIATASSIGAARPIASSALLLDTQADLTGFISFDSDGVVYSDMKQHSGFVGLTYRPPAYDVALRLRVEQFLYGDRGVEFEFKRSFGDLDFALFGQHTHGRNIEGVRITLPVPPMTRPTQRARCACCRSRVSRSPTAPRPSRSAFISPAWRRARTSCASSAPRRSRRIGIVTPLPRNAGEPSRTSDRSTGPP